MQNRKRNKKLWENNQRKKYGVNNLVLLVVRIWLSQEEAKIEILTVNVTKQKDVLQVQLVFFRNILIVTCSATLFNETKLVGNYKCYLSWKELFENFVEVLKIF